MAKSFAEKAGYIQAGGKVYEYDPALNKDGYYIVYSDSVKDRKTGKHIETPASVGSKSGVIEVSKSHFIKYTVPMRMFILCHEWSHHILDTRSEFKADEKAVDLYLSQGFPEIEAIYSLTKVFDNKSVNPEQLKRAEVMTGMMRSYVGK
jgi:hypothetical protein